METLLRQFKRMLFVLSILFLGFTISFGQSFQAEELERYIEKSMKDWQVPGLALGIVKDDSLIYAQGFGVEELGKENPVTPHTLFAIASNTKAFTASLLGMHVGSGTIDWDDPVINYMNDFRMYDPYVTQEINIRDCLTHRSGLPTFGGDHLWIGNTLSRDEIIARIRYLEPTVSFRTKYQYQNLMFLVAGQIIPEISDQTWDEAIKERIFQPLGMSESNTSVSNLKGLDQVAIPHEFVDDKLSPIQYDHVDQIAPAGGINSNVIDMSKWMRFNLNGGLFEGKRILPEKVMREIQSIQFPLSVSSFSKENFGTRFSGYGLGWSISDYKGYKMISHGGALSGMISRQCLVPEKKLGVIVLTNMAPNSLAGAICYRTLDIFLDQPDRDWSEIYLERRKKAKERRKQAEEKLQEKRIQDTEPSLDLKQYTGTYHNKLSGKAEVRLKNGTLVFDYNPRHLGDLKHWHGNTFRVTWRNPIFDMSSKSFITFYLDEKGTVTKLKVRFYHPHYFEKMTK